MLSFYKSFADQSQIVAKPPQTKPDHVMDQWLVSRIQTLIVEVTDYMDNYDVVRASRTMINFVDQLSTWYLRLSRDRLRSDDNQQPSQVFGYALYTLAQVFAPFAPFFSEIVHHSMMEQNDSIHLTNWPKTDSSLIDQQLQDSMDEVKNVVEQARSLRRELNIKLRQPLAKLTVASPIKEPSIGLVEIIQQEANVKQVDWKQAEQLLVSYETILTPELKAEGEAREIARQIQNLRKKSGLKVGDQVAVQLIEWPEKWASWIQEKTNSSKLVKGDSIKLLD